MADTRVIPEEGGNRLAARRWLIVAAVMLLIFAASSIPDKDKPRDVFHYEDKVQHFIAYGILAYAAYRAVGITWPSRSRAFVAVLAVAIASLYGISDELHQHFVPGRSREFFDWVADTIGASGAAGIAYLMNRKGGP